ncbi:MAG TPA: DUF998 domain-containing protein [Candidatus Dormibacteraeota bacterium]
MSQAVFSGGARSVGDSCTPEQRVTRSLLGYGMLAGPFYVAVALLQAAFRPGFDLLRHDVSLLSNGSWGWIQIANFCLTGAMVVACAVGVRRALQGRRGGTWGARLLGLYGLGLIGAGVFVADPMNGFPIGAPDGHPAVMTIHGTLHIVAAAIGFFALIGACWVIARSYAKWFSRATGVVFLLAFMGVASGSSSPAVVLAFWAALLLAWAWLGSLALHLYRS